LTNYLENKVFSVDRLRKTYHFCKVKGKVLPRTDRIGPEAEKRYSSTLSLSSALYGVRGQRHAPAALSPETTRYPLYRRLGGPQGQYLIICIHW